MTNSSASPSIVVTLVHGTILFARWPAILRALDWLGRTVSRRDGERTRPWYEEGSTFRARLEQELRQRECGPFRVERYNWSGGNTVWDRLRAAGEVGNSPSIRRRRVAATPTLRDHVAWMKKQFPAAAQVLIGHSHGGNVCHYALRDPDTRRAVKGLVCLSTPFVHARARHDSEALTDTLRVVGGIVYLGIFFWASNAVRARVPDPWDSIVFTVGFTVVIMTASIYWALKEHRRVVQRAWAESLASSSAEGPATFVMLSDGDEALLALKTAEGFGAVTRGLWWAASALGGRCVALLRAGRKIVVVTYTVGFAAALWWLVLNDAQSPWGGSPEQPWSVLLAGKFVLAAALIPLGLLLALLLAAWLPALITLLLGYPILWSLRWLAFGWGGPIGLDVTAEACPAGEATVVRLSVPPGATGLHHAHICNDERTPGLIAGFVKRV